ncbi:MAG TPA: DUF411 domain-containing protein [Candidatus Omnitrophota bacterium]|nr:DUF411 domain-containing protein [Candidatus Omnitrophota bacterium]
MRKSIIAGAVGAVALAGATFTVFAGPSRPEAVEVWKSPLCGCCGGWVEYMEQQGFKVTVHETDDMDTVKNKLGVPEQAWSCHTAKVAGYVLEGHVPVQALDKLLAEKPQGVTGIASPGMPQGSPGMTGAKEPNVVVTFGGGGVRPFGTY